MTTMPISNSAATSVLPEAYRLVTATLISTPLRSGGATAAPELNDAVTISKKAFSSPGLSTSRRTDVFPNIFNTYLDLFQQQRIAQSLIRQALSGTGTGSAGGTSVLESYQTLQYQRSIYTQMFNLKGDVFQSIFDITV